MRNTRTTIRSENHTAKADQLPWLDWARFAAAFLVLGVHCRAFTFMTYGQLPHSQQRIGVEVFFGLTRIGEEAVLLFFVLSGFLVGGRLIERARNSTFDVKSYAIDRATRILVPLLPAVVLSVLVLLPRIPPGTFTAAVGTLAGLQGSLAPNIESNGPFWTLAYEVWFYVIGGAAAAYYCNNGHRFGAALICILAMVIFASLEPHLIICWIIGALAYFWRPKKHLTPKILVALALIAVGTCQIEFGSSGIKHGMVFVSPQGAHVLFSIGTAFMLSILAGIAPPSSGIYGVIYRYGRNLAALSYTLYLTHYPTLWMINRFFPERYAISTESLLIFIGKMFICFVIAVLAYWLFERNTSAVRRFCHRHLPPRSA